MMAGSILVLVGCTGSGDIGRANEAGTVSPSSADTPGPDPKELAAELCSKAEGGPTGQVVSPELTEISGIAASHAHQGGLWAHNDSGDTARVFGVGRDGSDGGVWELAGVDALDWEDMASGPGPVAESTYLFLADIGDNPGTRNQITVHRIAEPDTWGRGGVIDAVDSFDLTYPDGPHDAESFLVDPTSGDWYVITKGWESGVSQVFRAPRPAEPGAGIVLEQVATVDLTAHGYLATAADVSADGRLVAVRTYLDVLIYPRPPGEPLESAFAAKPCTLPTAHEAQGEAFTFVDPNGYATIGEGSNPAVNVFNISG